MPKWHGRLTPQRRNDLVAGPENGGHEVRTAPTGLVLFVGLGVGWWRSEARPANPKPH